MAFPQVGSAPPKLSFAKVAAMRAPAKPVASSNAVEDKKLRSNDGVNVRKSEPSGTYIPPISPHRAGEPQLANVEERTQSDYVTNAIQNLSLVNSTNVTAAGPQSAESGESLADDQSNLSNSSTKQQSFDTKSMASVTTFAMDEKESIRPDDSASVRAADDDETSIAPGRELSFTRDNEPLAMARSNVKPNTSGVTIAARRYHTLTLTNPPRFGDLPVTPMVREEHEESTQADSTVSQQSGAHERASLLPVAPDEKLLDALANPKDRLPLLQLEEIFLGFIAKSDPTPLHILAQSIPAGPSQPPSAMAMKIMRRGGLGPRQGSAGFSTTASSSDPSKANSETGLETTSEEGIFYAVEGTPNKDKSKLTREEREAQYKAARERIFGDFQESVASENASTGENSASMSRSSSSSGKRKTRKHKTPKDDSFEARSAFIPSYAPMAIPTPQHQYQPQFPDQMYQPPYQGPSHGYGNSMNYGSTPTQAYPNFEPPNPYNNNNNGMGYGPNNNQPYSPADSWSSVQTPSTNGYPNYSASPPNYQQNVPPMMTQMNNQYMQQPHPGVQQSQPWMNNQFQAPYQQLSGPGGPHMNGWSGYQPNPGIANGASFGYGQVSGQGYNSNTPYNAPQQGPGDLSRSLFNPQTRSFVPSNATSRNGGRNGRKRPSPSSSQNRANNNGPRSFGPDASSMAGLSASGANFVPREDSLQQKYGAPAHLPKKPPPSQYPSSYDVETLSSGAGAFPVNTSGNAATGGSSS
ncbi:hypothetical protein LTR10_013424 [Elasticomyces elasticus]|nr:hypothetical protein LTR10_013424 [Elasticomyces elasticus]KAK5034952.1 hypothetical protein LTR13_006134 [Exophiala sideris]KAK5181197.1 hypothetical protein LTR44_006528 [Eurotiomycetes sp. CCFEE 6388]